MASFAKVNNERSEAIELIKLMDSVVKRNTWQIKSVGGESTLNTGQQRMFPDVFIYGDVARTQILQGWEVKMPDVPITDSAFIHDAQRKAEVLGVNSCVIWNFAFGVLYVKGSDGWTILREWNDTSHIRTRADVVTHKADWELLISDILVELNNFFIKGDLRPAKIGDIVTDTVFVELIKRNKGITSEFIRTQSVINTVIAAQISSWWRNVEKEYKFDEADKFSAYAKYLLLNWINKFTFANMIKGNHNPAALVETIVEDMTPANALEVFQEITAKCDFYNIFEVIPYSDIIPEATWADLTDYNAFLVDNGLVQIEQTALQSVLEKSVNQFRRNVAGVFATPQKLAKILVKAGLLDLTAPVIDPCCGTGTIVKEILDEKMGALDVESVFSTTYASDKSSFALQISNIAMTRANAINLPSLLFRSNAFDLREGKEIEIIDPQNGALRQYILPKWSSVVSNLPFVPFDQEGREERDNIDTVMERVHSETGMVLSGRIDLYQALLLSLHESISDDASVAVITSNSWLGTLSGQEFFRSLRRYFNIDSIVSSGNGKWFDNADVVTLMLFLRSKSVEHLPSTDRPVNFGLIHQPLAKLTDDDIGQISDSIKLKRSTVPELLTFRAYNNVRVDELLEKRISLNALFYDVDWLLDMDDVLCPISDLFDVFRGMKTGQDEIYYLRDKSVVDANYIGRVFKSAKSAKYLSAQSDTYSFVCGKTLAELVTLGHTKTLSWIERFRGHINQSVPNKETFWMNLSDGTFSGSDRIRLFTGMNPEKRIFYGLLDKPAQINQRAIGFRPLSNDVNLELCHALLNTIIGVFYVEASGFPKGLAALDTNKENIKRVKMLNPRHLSVSDAERILTAFEPIKERRIMDTAQEYLQPDRLAFERIVAECFGYTAQFDRIKNCLLEMQNVRLSVKRR